MSLGVVRRNAGLRFSASSFTSSPARPYGRSAPYRRLHILLRDGGINASAEERNRILINSLSRLSLHQQIFPTLSHLSSRRPFSARTHLFADQQKAEEVRDPPREEQTEKREDHSQSEDSAKSDGSESSAKSEKQEEKEKAAPPPHGNKTPWQVFTETLKTEFQASKEWNEGTKALSSSAHQFTENESVKRARAAYSAAADAATSGTSTVIKTTGKAIGQGAAWTWETPVVRGVRKGATVMGKGIDTATKPVRDTAAFKSIKDVIDDGSSSRYGGWVEKEERRKARELRELDAAKGGRRRIEKMEEDPK